MTDIIPIALAGDDLVLALDLLSEKCRDNEDQGVLIPAAECATLARFFERLAIRLMFLEGVERAARARALAEKALAAIEAEGSPIVVEFAACEAAILEGKVVRLPRRAPGGVS